MLVHNAFAPDVFQLFEDVDLAAWRHIMDVNLFGSLQLTKAAIPPMKAQGSGSIVFVNSMIIRKVLAAPGRLRDVEGRADDRGAGARQGARPAQDPRELDRARLDVGPIGRGVLRDDGAQTRQVVQEQYDEIASQIALGEIPTDDDCANAAVFFASDLSSVITGQALDVNGGEVFH